MYTLLRIESSLARSQIRPSTYPPEDQKPRTREPEDACLVELMNEVLTAEA
jgi:hypothetical protein